jgi:hypothetical protein
MMRFVCVIALVLAGLPALAQDRPSPSANIRNRLNQFDARAIAAANHYYDIPQLKSGILAATNNTSRSIMTGLARQNSALSVEAKANLQRIVDEVVAGEFGLMQTINAVAALETFSTQEMIALDDFYSSPGGQVILGKMPQLSLRMTPMIQSVVPEMIQQIRAKMRDQGVELKL